MRKALLVGALFSTATLTFATNGDNLIGLTPASRGMGGIGVGMPVGPVDSIFRNPAWMGVMKNKFTAQFGGILFMPKVKGQQKSMFDADDNSAASSPPASGDYIVFDSGEVKSKANTFVVPEIGVVHRISDRFAFGLGVFGVSGLGVDYKNETVGGQLALNNMHTTFQFMKIIPAVAFKVNEMITVSGAIHGAWGSLDIGATMCPPPSTDNDGDRLYAPVNPSNCWNAGGGQSQALGVGFQLGASLNFGDFLYAGLTYQSPVSMTYKRVFDSNNDGQFEDMKLQQPQEVALGIGAAPLNGFKVGLDVRWINWKDADGYGDFQWDNQIVYAIGAEYKPIDKLSLRVGYNYGKSPIEGGDKNGGNQNNIPNFDTPFSDYYVAWFNLAGFPAIAEQHITLGVGYEVNKNLGVDLSYVRALNSSVEACMQGSNCTFSTKAKMVQDSISIGATWKF